MAKLLTSAAFMACLCTSIPAFAVGPATPPTAQPPAMSVTPAAKTDTTDQFKAQMKEQWDQLKQTQKDQRDKLKFQQKDQRDKLRADQKQQRDKLKAEHHALWQKHRELASNDNGSAQAGRYGADPIPSRR
jgi:hypothetical protein